MKHKLCAYLLNLLSFESWKIQNFNSIRQLAQITIEILSVNYFFSGEDSYFCRHQEIDISNCEQLSSHYLFSSPQLTLAFSSISISQHKLWILTIVDWPLCDISKIPPL